MGGKCETDRIFRGFYLKREIYIREIYATAEKERKKKKFGNKPREKYGMISGELI